MIQAEKERLIKADISSIENQVRHAFNQGYDLGYKDGLQKNIKALPPVNPQPKTGYWIEHNWKEFLGEGYYRCSVCNHGYQRYTKGIRKSDVPYIDGQEYILRYTDHYCPNCGAKMVEPQESEEA